MSPRSLSDLVSPGERRVLEELLRDGAENKDIADRLGISLRTVKAHMTMIMLKMGATNRVQAVLAVQRYLNTEAA
jgi:DNA-binding NarL/FixJ family response regulator